MPLDYNAIMSTTLDNYRKTLVDQIMKDVPLWYWLDKKGRKRIEDGGANIIIQLRYALNSTVGSIAGYDKIDTTPQEGITACKWNWKEEAGTISISREEERKNSGEHRLVNLLEQKTLQTQDSFTQDFGEKIYLDGTGNGGRDITGLAAIVANLPTSGILAGIDRAEWDWWRNQYQDVAAGGTLWNGKFATCGLTAFRQMYRKTKNGADKADLIVTGDIVQDGYEVVLEGKMQIQQAKKGVMADAGYVDTWYKGIEMVNDGVCPEGSAYWLQSKYLQLVVDKESDFVTLPFTPTPTQLARLAIVAWMGNVTASNCQRLGVDHGFTE